jgi:transcription elongation factor GreB
MNDKNYITILGYKKLQDELFNMVTKERPELVKIINWAAGNGDRSENGDYIYGKKRLREVDKKIRWLTKRIEGAEVVDQSLHRGNQQIFFGAEVTIYRASTASEETIRIVGIDEMDLQNKAISWISPLARALLRKSVGDEIEFQSPSGVDSIEILAVNYAWQ